jgi:lysophospholipase L1-like esterase
MIGINDVWRQFDSSLKAEVQIYPEEFESTLGRLIERTRPAVKGMVLMTPFFIEPSRQDAMRSKMDQYGKIVRKLSERFDAVFVDTQSAFDRALEFSHSAAIAWDRVHPNQMGHMIIACAFLDGVGFKW